jgi:hypothetical protein
MEEDEKPEVSVAEPSSLLGAEFDSLLPERSLVSQAFFDWGEDLPTPPVVVKGARTFFGTPLMVCLTNII